MMRVGGSAVWRSVRSLMIIMANAIRITKNVAAIAMVISVVVIPVSPIRKEE